ncbi:MAG: hypothetical protein H7Y04_14080 [Verrucomicrobia bacterium]|nr:hypothetical protein [Cytophagales bacterium]
MNTIEIKFETASYIPPPFCHYYHLVIKKDSNRWLADFECTYHHREDLTDEDLALEGFTGEEDRHWKGEITENLVTELTRKFSQTKLIAEKEQLEDDENYLSLTFDTQTGTPKNRTDWEYFLQEIIQGIYEQAGLEKPLEIQFLKLEKNHSLQIKMQVLFAKRQANLSVEQNHQKKTFIVEDWQTISRLIAIVFNLDFFAEEATKKTPVQAGNYLETGDGLWYELGKTARAEKAQEIVEMNKILEGFLRYITTEAN